MIFFWGAYVRHFGFFLPSNIGDPTAYQSLAMKMNHGFMRHFDIFNYRMAERGQTGLVDYKWEPNPEKWNARRIRNIYHRPLHMVGPLYPILLWISHGIFNRNDPYTSVSRNLGKEVIKNPPWKYFSAQFYAIFVGYFFSLMTLALVYLFCLHFFSCREGLLATLILAGSPLEIAVGSRLYADGVLTFFTFLGLTVFLRSLERSGKNAYLLSVASGFFLGCAYLCKFSGIAFALAFLLAAGLDPKNKNPWYLRILNPRLLLAGITAFLVGLPWNWLIYKNYGTLFPLYPPDPNNPWAHFIFTRPGKAYFFNMVGLVPPTALGWLTGLYCLKKPRRHYIQTTFLITAISFSGLFLFFLEKGIAGLEDRYLMPVYPLLSILAAWGMVSFLKIFRKNWIQTLGYALVFISLIFMGWHSSELGLNAVFRNLTIFQPFGY